VFNIDIETCNQCGGAVKVIASIEGPVFMRRILDHVEHRTKSPQPAPPIQSAHRRHTPDWVSLKSGPTHVIDANQAIVLPNSCP
jgi:hypothetical protein